METILFDLDGTITDPFLGITKSVAYSLKSFGIEVERLDELKKFIGPPLEESFQEYYGMNKADSLKAVEKYREYFREKGLYENKVYLGMEEFLQDLKDEGKHLYICTSKPLIFAKEILEYFRLDHFFDGIYGSELDGTRNNKGDVIAYCMNCENLRKEDCLMVGDRQHDIIGAHENHIPCVGVLYGYGCREEFERYQCDYIVEDLKALKSIIDAK